MDDVKVTPRCFYCHTPAAKLQEDHVVPFSRGGSSLPRNLVLACERCNGEKNDRLPSEWRSDLHERVYVLERDLVAWHAEVDTRRAKANTSIAVGMWVAIGVKTAKGEPTDEIRGRVVGLDSRGLRIAPFDITYSFLAVIRRMAPELTEARRLLLAAHLAQHADGDEIDIGKLQTVDVSGTARWLPWSDIDWMLTSEEPLSALRAKGPREWEAWMVPLKRDGLEPHVEIQCLAQESPLESR